MPRVSTYLNFQGQTEEALSRYRDLFGGQFVGQTVRYADMPMPGGPELSADDAQKMMHMEVEIAAGHVVMATDMLDSLGQHCRVGNNTTIMVDVDSRDEVDRLYAGLATGTEENAPEVMPWGQYWCTCLDQYGIRWMFASD